MNISIDFCSVCVSEEKRTNENHPKGIPRYYYNYTFLTHSCNFNAFAHEARQFKTKKKTGTKILILKICFFLRM